jgi:ketosteroid isomerase-like protein
MAKRLHHQVRGVGMRAFGVTFVSTLLTIAAAAQPDGERAVLEAEQQWREASRNSDANALDGILADNFVGVGVDGKAWNKTEWIEAMKKFTGDPARTSKRESELAKFAVHDEKVQVSAEMAVVTGNNASKDRPGVRFVDVWVRRNGGWHLAVSQSTAIRAPATNDTHPPAEQHH